jgi:hypothetical protein
MRPPEDATERRLEPRHAVTRQRVRWKDRRRWRGQTGWLRDLSASGLSFFTHRRWRPAVGDEVRISARGASVLYEVRRVHRRGGWLVEIGCRQLESVRVKYESLPPRRLTEWRPGPVAAHPRGAIRRT